MDAIIVGGGIVGTTLAAELAAAEVDVTLFEKGELGSGTTATSAAVFTWQDWTPSRYEYELKQRSWETYRPLVADGTLSYEAVGMLTVATSQSYAAKLKDAVSELHRLGMDAAWIDSSDLQAYGIDSDGYRGGLHTSNEGYFETTELVRHFATRAEAYGATIRTETAVIDIHVTDREVRGVETDDGTYDADVVINAAGPWANELNAMVGVSAPLRHTVGPILVVEGATHELPFTLFESKYYLRPLGEHGAYVGRYLTEFDAGERIRPDNPPTIDDQFRTEVFDLLTGTVPALKDATVVGEWVGLRTITPDGRPLVGETDVEGFYLAVGMSGLGVTLAPAVAGLLTSSLTNEEPPDVIAPLAPDRF